MALDEPANNDKIEIVDDIKIGIDPFFADYLNDAVIDVQKVFWKEQLVVLSSIGSNC